MCFGGHVPTIDLTVVLLYLSGAYVFTDVTGAVAIDGTCKA